MAEFPLKLIVGLGNPGDEYARTRHNAGFWFVEELAARYGGTMRSDRHHRGETARVRIGDAEVLLLKPMQYMNRSGAPVGSIVDFYKIDVSSILVAHDELDLPVGTVRLKEGGGHGGHNGLRDLIPRIGEGFWRLRIGIGHPGERADVAGFVLRPPRKEEAALISEAIERSLECWPEIAAGEMEKAMHRLHTTS